MSSEFMVHELHEYNKIYFLPEKFIPFTFPRRIKFCSLDGQNGITQFPRMLRPCVWLQNFYRSYVLSVTPFFHIWTTWGRIWRIIFTMTWKTWRHYRLLRWNFYRVLAPTIELWRKEGVIMINVRQKGSR